MSQEKLAKLRAQIGAIDDGYQVQFAGHPRITRDPTLLDRMATDVGRAIEALGALPASPDRDALLNDARSRLDLYRNEAVAVRDAQAGGQDALEAHYLGEWSRFVFHRYRRHFAGQSRATRDLGVLAEMIADLRRIKAEAEALKKRRGDPGLDDTIERVDRNLQLYLDERGEIVSSRGEGTLEQQADVLAAVANDQFALYARHFAGKSRLSRRPALLQRIIDNLDVIKDRMIVVRDGGLGDGSHTKNIEIVESRATFYRGELDAIRKVRREASMPDLVGALGTAANELFAEYQEHFAGKDRRTRDVARLTQLCDALEEIGRQMDEIDRARPDETNAANLHIVLDTLRLYVREYDAVREAQTQNA